MSARYKVMCGCEFCISAKITRSPLLSWCDPYLSNLNNLSQIHKTEGLVKSLIAYLRHIKTMWCHTDVIYMQKYLTWLWIQCVHIHHPNIHCHAVNVCCVVVLIAPVLIFYNNNEISIITKHLLQYVFIFIT